MNYIMPARVAHIKRDTTLPQRLSLPINAPARRKANPIIVLSIYAASGLVAFAVIAAAITLI